MEKILYYTIASQEEGKEILSFLREKGFSKNILSSMKTISHAILLNGERNFKAGDNAVDFCDGQNQKICDMVQTETDALLNQVLFTASMLMRNGYARADN